MNKPLYLKSLWLRDYDLAKMKENINDVLAEGKDAKDRVFIADDVKSAVEWLKEQIDMVDYITDTFKERVALRREIKLLVDGAFPDLCPSGDLIADKQNPQECNHDWDEGQCKKCGIDYYSIKKIAD